MFNGNKIYIVDENGKKKEHFGIIPGLNIRFKGKNSTVVLHKPLPTFSKSRIRIKDNTYVSIGASQYQIKKLEIIGESKQSFSIGKNFFTYGCALVCGNESNLNISIGDECMFAKNIIVRASDGHSIFDNKTGEIINYGKDICIGDNVWIAGNVMVLKGVTIGNDSVIGHGSIVTTDCDKNSVYVGNPARKVKNDITWKREVPSIAGFQNKIDIVYLWVDSSDKNWQEKKNTIEKCLKRPVSLYDKCRYRNNDELKFALRSLEKNAPWINNIYIVTDNQIPEWLDVDNPRIKIVDHKEIISNEFLPTYNSNAILHSICNIKGLSEYFLYSDDDVFFFDKVEPNFFYNEDGYPIFRYGKLINKKACDEWNTMLCNADNLLLKKFGNIFRNTPHHCIDAYRLSDVIACKKMFNNEIETTISNRFRTDSDIERIIYSKYACLVKHGHKKVLYKKFHVIRDLINILKGKSLMDSVVLFPQSNNKLKKLNKIKPKLFCINDSENTTEVDIKNMKIFLEHLYPKVSSFEKQEKE